MALTQAYTAFIQKQRPLQVTPPFQNHRESDTHIEYLLDGIIAQGQLNLHSLTNCMTFLIPIIVTQVKHFSQSTFQEYQHTNRHLSGEAVAITCLASICIAMASTWESNPLDCGIIPIFTPTTPTTSPPSTSSISEPDPPRLADDLVDWAVHDEEMLTQQGQIRRGIPFVSSLDSNLPYPLPFTIPRTFGSFELSVGYPLIGPDRIDGTLEAELREGDEAAFLQLQRQGCTPLYTPEDRDAVTDNPGALREVMEFYRHAYNTPYLLNYQLRNWNVGKTTLGGHSDDNILDLLPNQIYSDKALQNPRLHRDQQFMAAVRKWVHCIKRRLDDYEKYQGALQLSQVDFDAAWEELIAADVLEPHERFKNQALSLFRPGELATIKWEWRLQDAEHIVKLSNSTDYSRDNQSTAAPERVAQMLQKREEMITQAKEMIDIVNKRNEALFAFGQNISQYMFHYSLLHRWIPFLDWAIAQLILKLEREYKPTDASIPAYEDLRNAMERAKVWRRDYPPPEPLAPPEVDCLEDTAPKSSQTPENGQFTLFERLPAELRRHIWIYALPAHPTTQFFDIINTPPSVRWRQAWSHLSFRVAPTTSHDSGYLTVYRLLSTTRESRSVVWSYYTQPTVHRRDVNCSPLDSPFLFETFDWIPSDDLIVLCFPPKINENLPAEHAIDLSLGSGHPTRNIGILLSRACFQVWNRNITRFPRDEAESPGVRNIEQIANFLEKLRKPRSRDALSPGGVFLDPESTEPPRNPLTGGIGHIYTIIEGWKAIYEDEHRYSVLESPPHDTSVSNGRRATQTVPLRWRKEEYESDKVYDKNTRAIRRWRHHPVKWSFDSMINPKSWFRAAINPRTFVKERFEDFELPYGTVRHVWWLGSGDRALGVEEVFDLMEYQSKMSRLHIIGSHEMAIDQKWPEYRGSEALGWLMPAENAP